MPLTKLLTTMLWLLLTACQETQFNGNTSMQSAVQMGSEGNEPVSTSSTQVEIKKVTYSSCDEAMVDKLQIVIAIDASVSQLTRDPECSRKSEAQALVQKVADAFAQSAIGVNAKVIGFAEDAFTLSSQWRNIKSESGRTAIQEELQGVCDRLKSGTRLVPVIRMAEEAMRSGMNGASNSDIRNYLIMISDGQPNLGETKEERRDSAKTLWQLPKTSVMTVAYAANNLGGDVPALKVLAEPADQTWSQHAGAYYRAEGASQLAQVANEMVQKISKCN